MKALEVVAAVFDEEGKYLIAQRPESSHLGGKWEFPGGKVEAGETHRHALMREMKEEFDADISVGVYIGDMLHEYPDKKIHLHFYHAALHTDELKLLEHQDICWETPEKIIKMDTAQGDIEFVRRYLL